MNSASHTPSQRDSGAERPTKFHNARIYTGSAANPWADTLIAWNGSILAIGGPNDFGASIDQELDTVDLGGRFVLPSFCDSHIHLHECILAEASVPLTGAHNLAEMQTRIAQRVQRELAVGDSPRHAGRSWLRGHGWNESRWPNPTYPTADDLDAVPGLDRPAIFWRSDMHVAVCNRVALALAGIHADTPDPAGGRIGRDTTGLPNGLLYDTAINLAARAIPEPDAATLEFGLLAFSRKLHTLGITAVHDQRLQSGQDGPRMLASYQRLHAKGELPLRIHTNISPVHLDHALALGLRSGLGDEWLRIGHVKYFCDGSLGSQTAWMNEPFSHMSSQDPSNVGLCLTPPAALRDGFRRCMNAGLSVSVHAIGDRANREVLDIFEELIPASPNPLLPHRIEHVQIMAPQDIPRLAALGLTASVQPVHLLDDMEISTRYLGNRSRWAYAFKTLAQSGARLAFGSDAPVADPNPLLGLHAAVYRTRPQAPNDPWFPQEGIDLAAAIRAYTTGPAQAVACSHLYGTLEIGKCADFVVLNQNPFDQPTGDGNPRSLADLSVEMTVIGGRIVHNQLSM